MKRARAAAGTGTPGHLRRLNLERVLAAVMDGPITFTRAELIDATGLSGPTVGGLVAHLIQSGVVRDLGAGPSRGGRRPASLEFNARHGFLGGIDLGPTRTRLAVADLRGEMLVHDIVPTPRGQPPALVERLAARLRALVGKTGAAPDQLLAVGVGAPGIVDREHGVVTVSPNMGFSQVPMRQLVERALGTAVVLENDVNLAMLGEHWRGAARGHRTCAFIFVGTGIGAGVLIDGDLHRGQHSMAGEIAGMCMGPQFVDVDYGSRGCLETLAGLQALAARWPGAAHGDPARWLAELSEASEDGDPRAREAIQATATLIGIAAANVTSVLDPSLIVLGGAVFAQAEPLVREVRRIVTRLSRVPVEIVVSALGREAPLYGSLLIASKEARRQVRHRLKGAGVAEPAGRFVS
jgi:glucokinase